ncbi:MAG TPA: M20/M25/M40 family metallo-hydrolase [Thermoanaerobaculaceae bacterium]|nr:M20/M25/M40 family metallo-hydrolase [Thermoanaerobaculaceae bacterium]
MRARLLPISVTSTLLAAALAPGQSAKPAPSVADDFVAAAPATPLPEPIATALGGITAARLAAHVRLLASPALEGRGLGSRGLDAAAEYVASSLALASVPPLGSGYFQPVPVREITGVAGQVTVERRQAGAMVDRTFLSGVDCLVPEAAPQTVTGAVVFAGYGIRDAALGRDDYRGLDLRGKVALVLAGVPAGPEWQTAARQARWAGEKPEERWTAKLAAARAAGAAAVLAVEADGFLKQEPPEPRYFLPFEGAGETPLIRVSGAVADALLASADLDAGSARSVSPRELPATSATIRITGQERRVESRNVVGVLAGADPRLRDEAIVLGAHIDHLGKVGETVYPGADDNASGSAALLEIARAFAASPVRPKRTVVFAFWTGEEEGKFGSGHWVRHPLWPLERTAAYLNLDMIGHPWLPEEIRKLVADAALPDGEAFLAAVKPADFVEPGIPDGHPELADALRRAARGTGLALHFDRTDGTHGGSDYRDFALARVPFIRFFGNFFPAYHEPGDTAEALDAGQVQRVARLAFATAWLLADR